eukprot:65683-Chlamydomonas_euryale.AAC.1
MNPTRVVSCLTGGSSSAVASRGWASGWDTDEAGRRLRGSWRCGHSGVLKRRFQKMFFKRLSAAAGEKKL